MRTNIGTRALVIGAVTIALLVAGCGSSSRPPESPSEPGALHIVNVDGPEVVSVFIAGTFVAAVACGHDATLAPGGSLPGLPWEVVVGQNGGGTLGHVTVSSLPLGLLIRGTAVLSGPWPMSAGPAAAGGCATSPGPSRAATATILGTTATAEGPPSGASSAWPAPSLLLISRERAIDIARSLGPQTATSPVLSATVGPFHEFDPSPNGKISEPSDAEVWHVVFALSGTTNAFIILDGYTGALVGPLVGAKIQPADAPPPRPRPAPRLGQVVTRT
jgi:hypothetical protein